MLTPDKTSAAMLMRVMARRGRKKPSSVAAIAPSRVMAMGNSGARATSGRMSAVFKRGPFRSVRGKN